MPIDLRKQYDLATDRTFNERVAMALYTVAREVLNEPHDTLHSPLRIRFAQGILTASVSSFTGYAAVVVADPTIAGGNSASNSQITDPIILTAIRNIWNRLSGVIE